MQDNISPEPQGDVVMSPFSEQSESFESYERFAEKMGTRTFGFGEYAKLRREANIDPASLTGVQITEALHQMR